MRTALIVEDHDLLRRMLGRLLEATGLRVTLAGTVAEALDASSGAGTPYAVAFVDVNLPDGNGLDVAASLRARGAALKVIAMSGNPHAEEAARVADAFLAKPFVAEDVLGLAGARDLRPFVERESCLTWSPTDERAEFWLIACRRCGRRWNPVPSRTPEAQLAKHMVAARAELSSCVAAWEGGEVVAAG